MPVDFSHIVWHSFNYCALKNSSWPVFSIRPGINKWSHSASDSAAQSYFENHFFLTMSIKNETNEHKKWAKSKMWQQNHQNRADAPKKLCISQHKEDKRNQKRIKPIWWLINLTSGERFSRCSGLKKYVFDCLGDCCLEHAVLSYFFYGGSVETILQPKKHR